MLAKIPLSVCLLLFFTAGNAQQAGFNILQYIDQLPPMAATVSEAYQQFYPKGKRSVYKQYEATLQAQINALADESKHQSALLSMLAERFETEQKQYNFMKVVIAEDPELKQKRTELSRIFLDEVSYYGRISDRPIDSIRQIGEPYAVQAEKMLQVYQWAVPIFIKKVKKLIVEMNELMNRKGYNAVLNNKVQTHKYYIQLLEVRGLLLDQIKQVNRMIDGSCGYVAAVKAG